MPWFKRGVVHARQGTAVSNHHSGSRRFTPVCPTPISREGQIPTDPRRRGKPEYVSLFGNQTISPDVNCLRLTVLRPCLAAGLPFSYCERTLLSTLILAQLAPFGRKNVPFDDFESIRPNSATAPAGARSEPSDSPCRNTPPALLA